MQDYPTFMNLTDKLINTSLLKFKTNLNIVCIANDNIAFAAMAQIKTKGRAG